MRPKQSGAQTFFYCFDYVLDTRRSIPQEKYKRMSSTTSNDYLRAEIFYEKHQGLQEDFGVILM